MRNDDNEKREKNKNSKNICTYSIFKTYLIFYRIVCLPVVPHKAVAEVSKIGNL
jgi:hypothetical protein